MALATSASEFFTSIVGVFFVKSDIACKLIKDFFLVVERKKVFQCVLQSNEYKTFNLKSRI